MWDAKMGSCRVKKGQQGAKTEEPDSNLDSASAQDLSMETSVKKGLKIFRMTERMQFLKIIMTWKAR